MRSAAHAAAASSSTSGRGVPTASASWSKIRRGCDRLLDLRQARGRQLLDERRGADERVGLEQKARGDQPLRRQRQPDRRTRPARPAAVPARSASPARAAPPASRRCRGAAAPATRLRRAPPAAPDRTRRSGRWRCPPRARRRRRCGARRSARRSSAAPARACRETLTGSSSNRAKASRSVVSVASTAARARSWRARRSPRTPVVGQRRRSCADRNASSVSRCAPPDALLQRRQLAGGVQQHAAGPRRPRHPAALLGLLLPPLHQPRQSGRIAEIRLLGQRAVQAIHVARR